MLATFLRVIIVMAVFLAGTLVGNIYMPQKKLESTDLVAVKEPVTSIDTQAKPDTAAAVNDLQKLTAVLTQDNKQDEAALSAEDNLQKTLLIQTYLAAKYKYELELLKAQQTPEQKDTFLKAKNDYNDAAELLEKIYPQISENEIEIISTEQNSQEPATETAEEADKTQPAQNVTAQEEAQTSPTGTTPAVQDKTPQKDIQKDAPAQEEPAKAEAKPSK